MMIYHLQLPLWNLGNIVIAMLVRLQNTHDDYILPSINKELSHYLEEVVSSEAWTCDSPRYETIADRDPPPTPNDQEIHHSVPQATPHSLGQSNYKDNINIIISLNAFFWYEYCFIKTNDYGSIIIWSISHDNHAFRTIC